MMPPGPDQGRCFDELPCDLGGPPPEVVSACEMRKAEKKAGKHNDGPGMTGGPGGMPGMHGGPGGMPNDGPGMTGGPGGMPNDGSFDPADHQRQLKKCEMMPPGPDQGRCFEAVPPPPMPPEMEKCNMMPPGPDQGRCFDELPCDLGGPPPEVVSACEMRKAGMHNDGPPGMTGGPSGMPGGQDGNPRP